MILANAIRITASEDFRALIIFNTDSADWPKSRDNCYQTVLTELLYNSMITVDFNENIFYENLIAMTALEETMGVREPRTSCVDSYLLALKQAMLLFIEKPLNVNEFKSRIHIIEQVSSSF